MDFGKLHLSRGCSGAMDMGYIYTRISPYDSWYKLREVLYMMVLGHTADVTCL